jgi:hypothetical protein
MRMPIAHCTAEGLHVRVLRRASVTSPDGFEKFSSQRPVYLLDVAAMSKDTGMVRRRWRIHPRHVSWPITP